MINYPINQLFIAFYPEMNLKAIISSQNPQLYQFPIVPSHINSLVPIQKPSDIDIAKMESKEDFSRFTQQVQAWLRWFDRFIDLFQYIIEYLKNWRVDNAEQLFGDIQTIKMIQH